MSTDMDFSKFFYTPSKTEWKLIKHEYCFHPHTMWEREESVTGEVPRYGMKVYGTVIVSWLVGGPNNGFRAILCLFYGNSNGSPITIWGVAEKRLQLPVPIMVVRDGESPEGLSLVSPSAVGKLLGPEEGRKIYPEKEIDGYFFELPASGVPSAWRGKGKFFSLERTILCLLDDGQRKEVNKREFFTA